MPLSTQTGPAFSLGRSPKPALTDFGLKPYSRILPLNGLHLCNPCKHIPPRGMKG